MFDISVFNCRAEGGDRHTEKERSISKMWMDKKAEG